MNIKPIYIDGELSLEVQDRLSPVNHERMWRHTLAKKLVENMQTLREKGMFIGDDQCIWAKILIEVNSNMSWGEIFSRINTKLDELQKLLSDTITEAEKVETMIKIVLEY